MLYPVCLFLRASILQNLCAMRRFLFVLRAACSAADRYPRLRSLGRLFDAGAIYFRCRRSLVATATRAGIPVHSVACW